MVGLFLVILTLSVIVVGGPLVAAVTGISMIIHSVEHVTPNYSGICFGVYMIAMSVMLADEFGLIKALRK